MDAFYASVEQFDRPELRGKPIAVGGSRERGVVAAASYEARKFGVRSAMPSKIAARKCKDLIFVKPRFTRYRALSHQIREVFYDYTDLVEPLSLDEAYLDVTQNKKGIETATDIAIEIKQRIKSEIGLTASAGVSVNKFLAKVASDYRKPDGLFIVKPHQVQAFVKELPIEKFFGVGKVTGDKMHQLGIYKGGDLLKYSQTELRLHFGKAGNYFYHVARGEDKRPVNPNRIRKSIGAENTFSEDIEDKEEMKERLVPIMEACWRRYQNANAQAFTVTVKVKYADFQQITRSKTLSTSITSFDSLQELVFDIIDQEELTKSVRLLGCTLSNFAQEEEAIHQLTLGF